MEAFHDQFGKRLMLQDEIAANTPKNALDGPRPCSTEELYGPLSPVLSWQTRIIALRPGTRGDPLVADLHIAVITHQEGLGLVSEDRNESYDALSYTWGAQTFDRTLLCNGHDFPITYNLYEALQRLRRRRTTRFVWVDAICINQYDPVEKARQIRNIFVIFQRARRVIVWLGRATRHSKEALDFASMLTKSVYSWVNRDKQWHESDARVEARRILKRHDEPTIVHILQGLLDLSNRAWIRRAWVVQEVHAASSIQVRCGPFKVKWQAWTQMHNILKAVVWFVGRHEGAMLHHQGYFSLPRRNDVAQRHVQALKKALQSDSEADSGDDSDDSISDDETNTAKSVEELRSRGSESLAAIGGMLDFLRDLGPAPNTSSAATNRRVSLSASVRGNHEAIFSARELSSILLRATHLKAVDDRDRVFALLGLTSVPTSYGTRSQDIGYHGIGVDYEQSTSEVYQSVAKYLIQKCQHLGPMYYKWATIEAVDDTADLKDPDLPTWCPDWRCIDRSRYLAAVPIPRQQHPWDFMTASSLDAHLDCIFNAQRLHFNRVKAAIPHWPGTYFVQSQDLSTPDVLKLKGRILGHLETVQELTDANACEAQHQLSRLRHSGVMNMWIMKSNTQLCLPAYSVRPDSPVKEQFHSSPPERRQRHQPAKRFTNWFASTSIESGDILAQVFGGLLPLILRKRREVGYHCVGYAAPEEHAGDQSFLELISNSLLTAAGIMLDEFDVY